MSYEKHTREKIRQVREAMGSKQVELSKLMREITALENELKDLMDPT